MELTQQEKQFIVELLSKLQFGIDGIEQGQFAKDIRAKLVPQQIPTSPTSKIKEATK